MRIAGGTFGSSGSVKISSLDEIVINGAVSASKGWGEIARVESSTRKERGFGTIGFLLGAPILCFAGWYLGRGVGVLIGFALAVMGSFYGKSVRVAEVDFKGGDRLTVEGSQREIDKLIRLGAQNR